MALVAFIKDIHRLIPPFESKHFAAKVPGNIYFWHISPQHTVIFYISLRMCVQQPSAPGTNNTQFFPQFWTFFADFLGNLLKSIYPHPIVDKTTSSYFLIENLLCSVHNLSKTRSLYPQDALRTCQQVNLWISKIRTGGCRFNA